MSDAERRQARDKFEDSLEDFLRRGNLEAARELINSFDVNSNN
jgi:hypothetical protein